MESGQFKATWVNPKIEKQLLKQGLLQDKNAPGAIPQIPGFSTLLTPESDPSCAGQHRYFVAETGYVESDKTVVVIIVCTQCGEGKKLDFEVAGSSAPQLRSQK